MSLRIDNEVLRNTENLYTKAWKWNGKWWKFYFSEVFLSDCVLNYTMCEAPSSASKKPYEAHFAQIPSYSLLPGWFPMELYKGRTSCRYGQLQNMEHRTFLLHTSKPKERKFKCMKKDPRKFHTKKELSVRFKNILKISSSLKMNNFCLL